LSANPPGATEHRLARQATLTGAQSEAAAGPPSAQAGLAAPDTAATAQAVASSGTTGTATAASATAAPAAPSASPTQQLAPALLSLSSSQNGTQHMTLRLNPAELGMVQVRIDRTPDGQANVAISADRPETLDMLRHDQPALQRALDQAGVPAEGRTLSFHAVQAVGSSGPGGGSANSGGNASGNATQGQSGSSQSGSAQSGAGGGFGSAQQSFYGSGRRSAATHPQTAQPDQTATPKWLRAGLDITA
jgi:chemotaxis protein MotD